MWGPLFLASAVAFIVWSSVLEVTGHLLVASGLAAAVAGLVFRFGIRRPARDRPHGDRRDVPHA